MTCFNFTAKPHQYQHVQHITYCMSGYDFFSFFVEIVNSLVSVAVPKTSANLIFVAASHLKEININIYRHSL